MNRYDQNSSFYAVCINRIEEEKTVRYTPEVGMTS